MSHVRVELLSRLGFVSAFPTASLDYSRTPWVQSASFFASATTSVGTFPILITKTDKAVSVFLYDRSWKKLSKTRRKELDPAGLLEQARRAVS